MQIVNKTRFGKDSFIFFGDMPQSNFSKNQNQNKTKTKVKPNSKSKSKIKINKQSEDPCIMKNNFSISFSISIVQKMISNRNIITKTMK
jgi:hypothetical protein